MKIVKLFLIFIPVIFFGCEKEEPNDEENPEVDVNVKFNITGFKSEIFPLKSSTNVTSNSESDTLIRKLKFLVYNEENNLVKTIDQSLDDDNFGKFELNLSKGIYKIGVVGYNRGVFSELPAPSKIQYMLFPKHGEGPISMDNSTNDEVFEYGINVFEIKSDTTFAPLELKRISAKLELKILDALPSASKWLLLRSEHDNQIRLFSEDNLVVSEYFNGGGEVTHDLKGLENTTGNSFYSVIFPFAKSGSKFDVTFEIFATDRKLLYKQKIEDVEFKSNYLTRISGEISAVHNENFSVDVVKNFTDTLEVKF